MKKIRLAMIGLGDMGTGHAAGFDQIEDCEIVWIADPQESNRNRALRYIRRNQPRIASDYRELLQESDTFDAVVIAVPNYLHKEAAIPFLELNKHMLLEKPVAHNLQDCDAIRAKAEQSSAILQIGLVYRYSNVYRRMKQELSRGKLGQVSMMWCKEFRDPFPPVDWFYDQARSGGTLVEKDCHHFDIFNWMIGAKPLRVFASGGQHVLRQGEKNLITNSYTHYPAKYMENTSIVDHAWVTIDYENGAKANLGLCMYLQPKNLMDEGLEIGLIGSNGAQMIAKKDSTIDIAGGADSTKEHIDIDVESDTFSGGHTGSQRQRKEFLESIRTGKPPFASVDVGRDALLIALAAEKSVKEERYVYISELVSSGGEVEHEIKV
ncbi:Gfo/Idh/MocA family protein [Paenibacillus hexagrammi]|uniref:Gfo/Idh/MocA family oxidoreductase n=1 Tax=Paenibacillus hexagrammi TaxID=2908839 RepID=A0ABY3SNP4_9BACL|nr:Gfo/Idh/MocA family oxidoreductase [Paenibacillus sp. YPD9-1]UJF35432.1 Gfo/Idh/MocA family oxidoreductase [Paenibacillus sp. YPD9-1]